MTLLHPHNKKPKISTKDEALLDQELVRSSWCEHLGWLSLSAQEHEGGFGDEDDNDEEVDEVTDEVMAYLKRTKRSARFAKVSVIHELSCAALTSPLPGSLRTRTAGLRLLGWQHFGASHSSVRASLDCSPSSKCLIPRSSSVSKRCLTRRWCSGGRLWGGRTEVFGDACEVCT
jgi:hypothetical protein